MKTKYYLYVGFYEWYISDKQLPEPLSLVGAYNSAKEAEKEAAKHDDWINYDEDILEETAYYEQFSDDICNFYHEAFEDKKDPHVFKAEELWKKHY